MDLDDQLAAQPREATTPPSARPRRTDPRQRSPLDGTTGCRARPRRAAGRSPARSGSNANRGSPAAGARVQDPQVEHLRERIPLLREPGCSGSVSRPAADEQDARGHGRARLDQDLLEPRVDLLATDRRDRRPGACREPVAQRVVVEQRRKGSRRAPRRRAAGRAARSRRRDDLGHAADRGRDDGRADGERLDRGMRQVLPARSGGRRPVLPRGTAGLRRATGRRANVTRSRSAELLAQPARDASRSGPSPTTTSLASSTCRAPRTRSGEPSARSAGRRTRRCLAVERLGRDVQRRRRRIDEHLEPPGGRGPSPPRARPGTGSARRRARRAASDAVRRRLSASIRGPAARWKLLESSGEEPVAPGALVGGIGDELRDERSAGCSPTAAAAYVAVA